MSQQEKKDVAKYFYRGSAADFLKIPGGVVAYWASRRVINLFQNLSFESYASVRQGMATTDNERFLRRWYELSINAIGFNFETPAEGNSRGFNWFPYNKGGEFRKWYGNFEYVVNYENDGENLIQLVKNKYPKISDPEFVIKNRSYYCKEAITWSDVTSGATSFRYVPKGMIFDGRGSCIFPFEIGINQAIGFLNSPITIFAAGLLNPTAVLNPGEIKKLPCPSMPAGTRVTELTTLLIGIARQDWDDYEYSWDFFISPIIKVGQYDGRLSTSYRMLRVDWKERTAEMHRLEEENSRIFIETFGLEEELSAELPKNQVTITCNPDYRYGRQISEEDREDLLQCDTLRDLISYAVGCMMGRYSLDTKGLIIASQGETLQDYLGRIPSPSFAPDEDAILPLTDQEWFADDATNRFREFIRVVWGDEHLEENLDFVAESLCPHAIKSKRGESALDTIRRYLSTQFYKDHLRTYKKRPIYWLFSSGKHKAFECLVYLHRYNEGTLARMRTEYVIPLSAKLNAYAEKLEQDNEASTSAAETKRLEKEIATLHKQQAELAEFDEKLRHYADQRISLDLDDGVKVNYGKFGDLLAEVKAVTGQK